MVAEIHRYLKPHVAEQSQALHNARFAFTNDPSYLESAPKEIVEERDVALNALLDLIPMGNEPSKTA